MGTDQSNNLEMGTNGLRKSFIETQCKEKQNKIMKNGQFNKDKFGLELKYFLNNQFDEMTIQGSELHARLFKIFDESNDNTISQDEFLKGMTKLVLDKKGRAELMFRILDKYKNNTISKPEFDDQIRSSYHKGCKAFKKLLQSKKVDRSFGIETLKSWEEQSCDEFTKMMTKQFYKWSNNQQYMTMENIENLCSEMQDLNFELGDIKMQIPLCLYNWEFDLGV